MIPLDPDPLEIREWLDAISSVVEHSGPARGAFVLAQLRRHAATVGIAPDYTDYSAYRNTISLANQAPYPGDLALEERLTALVRWNALAMVSRANRTHGELGGHLASYASAAEIFEVGFNHFFRGPEAAQGGDLIYFQPHSAPGVYARAYLEGRL